MPERKMPPTKNSQANASQEELKLRVMRVIEENPTATQREIAQELNVSLGGVNYCLKALVDRGLVKLSNFAKSERKMGYAYILTPEGVSEKAKITVRFLKRKMAEYELLQQEIEQLKFEVGEINNATD
ncbi:MarR family EPS-associated transcriptional regulator [Marinobacterium sp. xm-a-152]|uniref:MarR family EPS-associated transcriptional regulator n=1 Tax=Marinobacterium sp. xm-a-152 TaxID=2497733 RepID=UPI0019DBFA9C|nr:MarR family EPS-associated transcriptional regulator [Marinobacterium sp. xm-a-152]NRP15036.1 MarR family protein [Marinobacterium sp. xm-a-152]